MYYPKSRSQLLAMLIEKLLDALMFNQETVLDLNIFLRIFEESIALFDLLQIADHGSYVLFYMVFQCSTLMTKINSVTYFNFGECWRFTRTYGY